MNVLIPLREYIIEETKTFDNICWDDLTTASLNQIYRFDRYAKLLSQFSLSMFLPCDLEGNMLEEPKPRCLDYENITTDEFITIQENYQDALDKVLFKNVRKISINEYGSFSLVIDEIQIGYYKGIPKYWVWNFKNLDELTKYCFDINEAVINKWLKEYDGKNK